MKRATRARGAAYGAVLLAAFVLTPFAAFAAEATEHEGMPQLNFANPLTVSQIVWMAVVFLAFYMLLSRWALPMVAGVIESRAASIAADLQAAHTAKAESDAAAREVASATRAASAEAQARIAEAVAQAKAEAAVRAEESNRRLEQLLVSAEEQITAARTTAMGALREVASETAMSVVYRLTGRPSEPHLIDEAVGDAIAARAG
jgi:F-type H+-transporting ATPase subunit b